MRPHRSAQSADEVQVERSEARCLVGVRGWECVVGGRRPGPGV